MVTGLILKNMRLKAGLSQKKLGKIVSLADTTISSYERGNSQPNLETIVKIAKVCGYKLAIIDSNNNILSLERMSKEV